MGKASSQDTESRFILMLLGNIEDRLIKFFHIRTALGTCKFLEFFKLLSFPCGIVEVGSVCSFQYADLAAYGDPLLKVRKDLTVTIVDHAA